MQMVDISHHLHSGIHQVSPVMIIWSENIIAGEKLQLTGMCHLSRALLGQALPKLCHTPPPVCWVISDHQPFSKLDHLDLSGIVQCCVQGRNIAKITRDPLHRRFMII